MVIYVTIRILFLFMKEFDKFEFYARVAICKVLGKSLDELFWEES